MIESKYLWSKKVSLIFEKQGQDDEFYVQGRNAQSLLWLIHKGVSGVTSIEVSSWALRLGAYVYVLRHKYGLQITTEREPHEGGVHARYVLRQPVELVEIFIPYV